MLQTFIPSGSKWTLGCQSSSGKRFFFFGNSLKNSLGLHTVYPWLYKSLLIEMYLWNCVLPDYSTFPCVACHVDGIWGMAVARWSTPSLLHVRRWKALWREDRSKCMSRTQWTILIPSQVTKQTTNYFINQHFLFTMDWQFVLWDIPTGNYHRTLQQVSLCWWKLYPLFNLIR